LKLFSSDELFIRPVAEINDEYLISDGKNVSIRTGGYKAVESDIGIIGYGEFLKRLNKRTSLPVAMLHRAITTSRQGKSTPAKLFNTDSLEKIIQAFEMKFMEIYNQKFTYQSLEYTAQTSLFEDGDFVHEMNQTYLGEKIANDVTIDKNRFLYDKVVYDSDIEHAVLKVEPPEQIIVYGKLPRKSIKLPTYTGGTTSPDFVYTVRGQKPDEFHIHLVVETKSDNPRLSDTIAVESQKKAFQRIGENIKWDLITDVKDFQKDLENLIGKKM
jgi:type III restriction enzyme